MHPTLRTMQSQPALNKSYAIGDKVLFEGSPEPYIFLGEKQIHQHNNGRQDGYLAEFRAPREPSYPPRSIQLVLHHRIQRDRIIPPPRFLSWDWFKAKLQKYCCFWLTVVMRWSISEPQRTCFRADEDQWMIFIGGPFYCSFIWLDVFLTWLILFLF